MPSTNQGYIDRINRGLVDHHNLHGGDLLTFDIVTKPPWKYCGGRQDSHFKYYLMCSGDICGGCAQPDQKNECLCGQYIQKNCYTTDGSQMLVWGNCCINKFMASLQIIYVLWIEVFIVGRITVPSNSRTINL